MPARDRLPSIQALRGIAAMLVVLHHCINLVEEHAGIGSSRIAAAFWNNDFGASGVDLFFVISGFVMAHALDGATGGRGPAAFLADRFCRIVPLFWLLALASAAVAPTLGAAPGFETVANTLTFVPLLDRGRYDLPLPSVGWTLAFEFVFYALVASALTIPARLRHGSLLTALAVLASIGLAMRPTANALAFATNPILLEFALGVLAQRVARHPLSPRLSALLLMAGTFKLAWTILTGFGFGMDPWPLIEGVTPLERLWTWGVPWSLVLLGTLGTAGASGPVGRIGDASYSLYLSHVLVLAMVEALWRALGWAMPDLALLASFVVALGAGLLVYRLAERPLRRRLERLRTGRIAFGFPAVRPNPILPEAPAGRPPPPPGAIPENA